MTRIIRCVLLIGLVSLPGLAFLACSPKPTDVISSYQQAYNSGDVAKVVSLYTQDASFEMPGLFSLQGREALRQLAEYDVALHLNMEISQTEIRGDSVICQLKATNDWFEMAGIGAAQCSATFVVRQGHIASVKTNFAPMTDRVFSRVFIPLMEWARAERPDLLVEMMPEGEFVYNAENAGRTLSLLQEWKQNLHRQGIRPVWRKLGE